MSQPVLLKVYGNVFPANEELAQAANLVMKKALPPENALVEREADLIRLAFEGIWFPQEEMLDCLKTKLPPSSSGKLDILDMENWQMTRFIFRDGQITRKQAPLDNVLDYSGF